MYIRKHRPKNIFPKRLSGLMESYEIEKGRRGISNIGLARLLYEKRNGADDASVADDRYAVERENGRKAIARKISRFRKGDQFPQWDDLVDLADIFGKPVGFLIGETDCDTYELQDIADFLGLSGEAVLSIEHMTREVSAEWLLEQSNGNGGDHEEWEKYLVNDMVAKANGEPEACRAVLNRMLTAAAFKDLVLCLSEVGDAQYNLLMERIASTEIELRDADALSGNHPDSIMGKMAAKSRFRDAATRLQEAENAVRSSRYAAYECHVRIVDEMFSNITQTDANTVAKEHVKPRQSGNQA